ncbi:hypothetical protein ES703_96762 [subsurface metagenome]
MPDPLPKSSNTKDSKGFMVDGVRFTVKDGKR